MMKVGIVFAAALFALSVQATVRPVWEEPDQEGKGAEIRMLEGRIFGRSEMRMPKEPVILQEGVSYADHKT